MKHLYAVGDLHGNWSALNKILQKNTENNLVQIGDLGLGFPAMKRINGIWQNVEGDNGDPKKFPDNFFFVRGNHDRPEAAKNYPNYLGDYGFNENLNIFYVSGAASHDKDLRTQGVDWWVDEELSIPEFQDCINLYEKIKPKIVISHEPPVVAHQAIRKNLPVDSSRTSQALQSMFEIWQPEIWVHGHHHVTWSKQIGKTKFTCAAINQVVKIY